MRPIRGTHVASREILSVLALLVLCALPCSVSAQVKFERGGGLNSDGAFRLHTLAGSVKVTGWDRDSVHVRGTVPKGMKPIAGGGPNGWKMSIYEGTPTTAGTAELEIFVPRGAQVWVKATSASITASGLTGSVDLNTIEGRIITDGSPRELRIETMRGDVAVRGAPGWMRLKSGDGNLVFDGQTQDGLLSTVRGSITTTSRLQRGRIETVGGAVRIAGPIMAGSVLDIDSHSGAVELVLDQPVNATISVFTVSGKLVNSIGKSSPRKAFGTGVSLDLVAGNGKARVMIRTFSGAVSLSAR